MWCYKRMSKTKLMVRITNEKVSLGIRDRNLWMLDKYRYWMKGNSKRIFGTWAKK